MILMILHCATCKHARFFHPSGGHCGWRLRGKCGCEQFRSLPRQ